MSLKVLFVTSMWPDDVRPWYGPFVKRQADSLEALGVKIDALPIRGYAGRGAYGEAAAAVARLNRHCPYDVVHAHYGHAGLVARLQFRAPLVVTYWGSDLLGTPRSEGGITLKTRIEAAVFRQLAPVCAATMTQSVQMEGRLPLSCRSRNHVIPAGIDLERFKPLGRDDARGQLGWDPTRKVALFAANPDLSTKNFPLAQEVCGRLSENGHPVDLRVAWGVDPDLIPVWMSAADALLFPSRSEGSPNVIKEAMAAELPIVSTPVGDVEERLRGVPGCFVRPSDPEELADALVAALAHGRTPEARTAVAPLGMRAIGERVVSVYESVRKDR